MAEQKILPNKHIAIAVEEAKALIQVERSGEINGLFTRWRRLNKAKFKYWRFGTTTGIAGMSGSGKSAILNMLEDDFTNPELNPTFLRHINEYGKEVGENKIAVLAFKYEMSAADEVLRTLSGKVKKSYSHILSSESIKVLGQSDAYNVVTKDEYKEYEEVLERLKKRPITYIENAGNLEELWNTYARFREQHPNKKVIVTIDHTLLSKKLNEKDDLELVSRTAHTCIRMAKTGALVIPLLQMNGEIEKANRRENLDLQFPVKTDIHCGNQIYWACDDVIIFHRPELLHITKYGKFRNGNSMISLDSKGLIHGALIKSRKNKVGNIFFREKFKEGSIEEIDPAEAIWKSNFGDLQIPD